MYKGVHGHNLLKYLKHIGYSQDLFLGKGLGLLGLTFIILWCYLSSLISFIFQSFSLLWISVAYLFKRFDKIFSKSDLSKYLILNQRLSNLHNSPNLLCMESHVQQHVADIVSFTIAPVDETDLGFDGKIVRCFTPLRACENSYS